MIIDQLQALSRYESNHPRFPVAFAFLKQLLDENAPDGRYDMPNCDCEGAIYVNIVTGPVNPKTCVSAESHQKYIDVQLVLDGLEVMYVPNDLPDVTVPYRTEKDVSFYAERKVEDCHRLLVPAGQFAIFFANELHAPSVSPTREPTIVRKAILKVLA